MKFCTQCGNQLADEMRFCMTCGAQCTQVGQNVEVIAEPISVPEATREYGTASEPAVKPSDTVGTKQKRKKRKLIAILCVVVLLIGIGVGSYFGLNWYFSDEQQLLRALDAGDYDAALELVDANTSLRYSETMEKELRERLAAVKSDFTEGTVEFAKVNMELDTIEAMRVKALNELLSETRGYVVSLNVSRTRFATAEEFFAAENYVEAMELYAQVIEEDSNYETAKAKYTEAVGKYRDHVLEKAAQYANAGNYQGAITILTSALTVIPGDAAVTEQKSIYQKNYSNQLKSEALTNASEYAAQGDYSTAMQMLTDYISSYGDDVDINIAYQEYFEKYIDTVLVEAEKQAATGDYLGAMKTLSNIMNNGMSNTELISAYNGYCDKYVDGVIVEVDKKMVSKDFDEANAALYMALKNLPQNNTLLNKVDEVNAKRPIDINDLLAVNTDDWGDWNSGSPMDTFGNDYSTACNYVIMKGYELGISSNEEHYVEYRLYANYSTLAGKIATQKDSAQDRIVRLQVYVDDTLAYTSGDIGRKTDAIEFSVDVSGAQYVKIVVYTDARAIALLSDVQLWP